jgi:hypothetical protein
MFSLLKGHKGYHYNELLGQWEFIERDSWIFSKVFRSDEKGNLVSSPAMLPTKFELYKEVEPDTLEEAFEVVKEIAEDRSLLAIRAKKTVAYEPFKRNKANFNCSVQSKIIAMDIDSVPMPAKLMTSLDLHEWAEYVIGCMSEANPDVFTPDIGYIAHASSSAGLKENIRMHLLLESSIPVNQSQLKYLFSELNNKAKIMFQFEIADLALYSQTQPHFFSDPLFYDGVRDPFKGISRLVYQPGEACNIPANLPEFVSKKADLVKKDFELFNMIDGKKSLPNSVNDVIKELADADDGVYLRIIPKLYHRAWQNGVDIKWLERQIKPLIEQYIYYAGRTDRRPEQYMNNGRSEALRAFLGEARRMIPPMIDGVMVEGLETDSNEDEVYLKMRQLPPKKSITFVKASLGTGKTTAVTQWLKSGMVTGGFLAVTNTRSLVSSNAKKFNAGEYNKTMDMLDFSCGTQDRMSTTIHSLHKFANCTDRIKFLFIDECDAVMNDLLFSPLVKKRRECINTLFEIMMNADYVILSDGDISEETVSAYGSLIDYNKDINYINHSRKMLQDAMAYEFCDDKSIWAAFKSCIELGEKCILVSDCSPDEINEKCMIIRNQTHKVIKEVHSASTEDEDIRKILDYTNEELRRQGIEGLVCSPSVTSGVDFNYFDNVFVITRSNNHTPNLRFQALRRDRGARFIFYYTSPDTRGFLAGSDQYMVTEGWLEKSQQLFAKRREIESMNFENTFRYYLMEQGCKIKIIEESWGDVNEDNDYEEQRIAAILSSSMSYKPPRHNDAFDVKQNIVKYYHLDSTDDLTHDIVKRFLDEKPDKRAEFFHKLYPFFWKYIKECVYSFTPFIEAIKENKREFYLATGCNANPRFVKMYLRRAGIEDPDDYEKIIDWYRTYCIENSIDIPVEFLTEEEQSLRSEGSLELL